MAEAINEKSMDFNDLELECSAVKIDDSNTTVIVRGATVAAFTNDTIGTTPEDGYINIEIAGTTYKVPFWQDNA